MTWYVIKQADIDESPPVTDWLSVDPVVQGDADRCPRCGGYISMLKWLPPHRAELEVFGGYADLAFFAGEDLLVSERFKRLYEEAGLIGLRGFEPVEIVRAVWRRGSRKCAGAMPKYFHALPVRSRAEIDEVASEAEREPPGAVCPECHGPGGIKRWKRIVLKQEPEPIEDIFEPRGNLGTLVSQRFHDLCQREGITGARFIDASQAGHDFYPWEHEDRE